MSNLEKQIELTERAKEVDAIEADKMFDYVEFDGIKFYRPTVAHAWVLAHVGVISEQGKLWDEFDLLVIAAWLLSMDSKEVRNKGESTLRKHGLKTLEIAQNFVYSKNIGLLDVVAPLMDELDKKKP